VNTPFTYDYVVVGGGSAGCVVAARLAEEKQGTVLLIESGESARSNPETLTADGFKDTFANDRTMWDRMSTLKTSSGKRSIYAGSGTGMGGSGSVNGMVYTRGDHLDFAEWPSQWKWENVIPAFEALEARLGIRQREPTRFTETAISASIKAGFQHKDGLNDGDLCGFIGYNGMNFQGDQRRSSYTGFIHDREVELELLTVKTQSRATRILFDENQTAITVEYVEQGVNRVAHINKELILCAGALETPKLLMLSGVGPADELKKFGIKKVLEAPGIGQNLQDHPSVAVIYKGKNIVDFRYPQLYGFHRVNKKLTLPENQADTCFVFLSVGSVLKHTLKRMVPVMALPGKLYDNLMLRKWLRKLVELFFAVPLVNRFAEQTYGIIVILGKPLSRGELRLNSTDPNDTASINLAYFKEAEDMATMIAGIKLAGTIAQQSDLVAWGNKSLSPAAASEDRQRLQKWIEANAMTVFHYCGTCSMGESAEAPVDLQLKLKGIRNVRIADASVIPVIPVSALNAPSMMIGYRAAEFIIGG
jgi:choline dehydrogenase